MARRTRRSTKTNTYLWYALYVGVAYYGYNWFKQYQAQKQLTNPQVAPQGAVTQ